MKAATQVGLCLHMGIIQKTWIEWRATRPELSEVITCAEDCIREQKFTGTAADPFNPKKLIAISASLITTSTAAQTVVLSRSRWTRSNWRGRWRLSSDVVQRRRRSNAGSRSHLSRRIDRAGRRPFVTKSFTVLVGCWLEF